MFCLTYHKDQTRWRFSVYCPVFNFRTLIEWYQCNLIGLRLKPAPPAISQSTPAHTWGFTFNNILINSALLSDIRHSYVIVRFVHNTSVSLCTRCVSRAPSASDARRSERNVSISTKLVLQFALIGPGCGRAAPSLPASLAQYSSPVEYFISILRQNIVNLQKVFFFIIWVILP